MSTKAELISDRAVAERSKADFSEQAMLGARAKSWKALERIREQVRPGMTEEDVVALSRRVCEELGGTKHWHMPKIRFEQNTLLNFSEKSEPGVLLKDDSIFFIDLGPVFDGYEGDVGETFAMPKADADRQRCATDCKTLFEIVHKRWKEHGESGHALYEFAKSAARDKGWELNAEITGHRVADFPHALYFKGSMGDMGFKPSAYIWVLEIQIRHPSKAYGAFYEDILVD
jgi:Xaa-Pro aminopeptidase